jgi:hypothetical protein
MPLVALLALVPVLGVVTAILYARERLPAVSSVQRALALLPLVVAVVVNVMYFAGPAKLV